MMASALGSDRPPSACPGLPYSLRTGWPVCVSSSPMSQEVQGGWGGDEVGVPAAGACVADQPGDLPGRSGAAGDHVQDRILGESRGGLGDDAGSAGERAKLRGGIAVFPLEHFAESLPDWTL